MNPDKKTGKRPVPSGGGFDSMSEAEMLSAIREASSSKAKKIRTPCNRRLIPVPPSDVSRFDALPAEILEEIIKFLNNEDIKSFCEANKHVLSTVKNSSKFKYHLVERHILLKQVGARQAVKNVVVNNYQLRAYLNTNVTFVRLLPELRGFPQRMIANAFFNFGPSNQESKMKFLLNLAVKRFEYRQNHLFVVIATSEAEAKGFVEGLTNAGYESAFFSSFNSNDAFNRVANGSRKFFFVVKKLTLNFRHISMRAIIDFRKLGSFEDLMEFHCLNPKSVYTYVDIDDRQQMFTASDHLRRLNVIGQKPLQFGKPLMLSRSFYMNRVSFDV